MSDPVHAPRGRTHAPSLPGPRRRSALAGWLALAALALVSTACSRGSAQPPGGVADGPPPLQVDVLEMKPRSVPTVLDATARTEGSREVEVRARVTGILERQLFREGEPIRAGAPMYRIERAPFEIALAQARAAAAQEEAKLERARTETARLKPLVEQRAISRREYDDAVSQQRQSSAALQMARASVREAELNLSYTEVNAPISGITGRSLRSQGSLVTAGTDSSLLTTVTRTDPIWVRFALSQSEYTRLRAAGERATKVTLTLPDGSRYDAAGKLNFTGSTIDEQLGTVQMRAEFSNPSLALLPGQFVNAHIEVGERQAFVVPQPAVQQAEQGQYVWTLDASNRVEQRFVQTNGWLENDWIVREGLKPGDRVVVDNVLRLRPGMTVEPKLPASAATPGPSGPSGKPGKS